MEKKNIQYFMFKTVSSFQFKFFFLIVLLHKNNNEGEGARIAMEGG